MSDDEVKYVELVPPDQNKHNIEANKYFIFNQTGNIMMASTDADGESIPESVREVFAEVSVFFAAMTKAITTTNDPVTEKPYSLYNYKALEKIIGGSGMFVWMTLEDIHYKTKSSGATFSKELLEGLLGLAAGAGAMSFAQAMLASVGQEGMRIGEDSADTESSVANIVFVCEYLMGMPVITAIVVYANVSQNYDQIKIGPCFEMDECETEWTMHKDTYMFVTPTFVKKYAGDLDAATSNAEFNEFVEFLRSVLTDRPMVTEVIDENGDAIIELTAGERYTIQGVNLENTNSLDYNNTGDLEYDAGGALETTLQFSVNATASASETAYPIILMDTAGEHLASTDPYKMISATDNVAATKSVPAGKKSAPAKAAANKPASGRKK